MGCKKKKKRVEMNVDTRVQRENCTSRWSCNRNHGGAELE